MGKRAYFDPFVGEGWPTPSMLKPYFLGTSGRPSSFESDNDCWGLSVEGRDGTEHLQPADGRIDVRLTMVGHARFGVLLYYYQHAKGHHDSYYSKGNLSRLREWVRTKQDDLMPIGMFVPFENAWSAVKEFMETEGALPRSIEWIASEDLPSGVFPEPWADVPL
jgi:hypothetical protein